MDAVDGRLDRRIRAGVHNAVIRPSLGGRSLRPGADRTDLPDLRQQVARGAARGGREAEVRIRQSRKIGNDIGDRPARPTRAGRQDFDRVVARVRAAIAHDEAQLRQSVACDVLGGHGARDAEEAVVSRIGQGVVNRLHGAARACIDGQVALGRVARLGCRVRQGHDELRLLAGQQPRIYGAAGQGCSAFIGGPHAPIRQQLPRRGDRCPGAQIRSQRVHERIESIGPGRRRRIAGSRALGRNGCRRRERRGFGGGGRRRWRWRRHWRWCWRRSDRRGGRRRCDHIRHDNRHVRRCGRRREWSVYRAGAEAEGSQQQGQ